jgi:hypothetical protein
MMNRNAKIALGCGGAGCLGLILLVIVCGVLIYVGAINAPGVYSPNRRSSINVNLDRNSNFNANTNENSNSDSSSASSMSDDDKHKLLMAASFANDSEMMQRVMRKLGFMTDTGVSSGYAQFLQEHAEWAHRNQAFIDSVNTQESARAYLVAHIDD